MSNRQRLRPGQVAAQDQALARVREMAREYGAVVTVYSASADRVCRFAEADDSPCRGPVSHVVHLRLHDDPRERVTDPEPDRTNNLAAWNTWRFRDMMRQPLEL